MPDRPTALKRARALHSLPLLSRARTRLLPLLSRALEPPQRHSAAPPRPPRRRPRSGHHRPPEKAPSSPKLRPASTRPKQASACRGKQPLRRNRSPELRQPRRSLLLRRPSSSAPPPSQLARSIASPHHATAFPTLLPPFPGRNRRSAGEPGRRSAMHAGELARELLRSNHLHQPVRLATANPSVPAVPPETSPPASPRRSKPCPCAVSLTSGAS